MSRKFSLAGLLVLATLISNAQTLELYPPLETSGNSYFNQLITDTRDGGYLIGSAVDFINGTYTGNLTKIDDAGNLVSGFAHIVVDAQIKVVLKLANGNILIGGEFTEMNDEPTGPLVLLDPDGNRITSFLNFPDSDYQPRIWDAVEQRSGKIIVSGSFETGKYSGLIRLNSDGSVDFTFPYQITYAGGEYDLELDEDDNLWANCRIGDLNFLQKWSKDGVLAPGFPVHANAGIRYLRVISDHAFVGGDFTAIGNANRHNVARVNEDGSIDSFTLPQGGYINSLTASADGKVIVGHATPLKVYNTTGELIATLTDRVFIRPYIDRNQRLVILNNANPYMEESFRYNADLSLDETFKFATRSIGDNYNIVPQIDGPVIASFNSYKNTAFGLKDSTRFYRIDKQRATTLLKTVSAPIHCAQSYDNGFYSLTRNSIRFHNNKGTVINETVLDANFNELFEFQLHQEFIYVSGNFLSVNGHSSPGLVRLHLDGSVDASFQSPFSSASVEAFAIQKDGKVVVAGTLSVAGTPRNVVRLESSGAIDTSFMPGSCSFFGGHRSFMADASVKVDAETGNIFVFGNFWNYNTSGINYLVKLDGNGVLDHSFAPALPVGDPLHAFNYTSLEIINSNFILIGTAMEFQKRCLAAIDASGNVLSAQFTEDLGVNSSIYKTRFDGYTLFLAGRLFSRDHNTYATNARVIFRSVTGDFGGLAGMLNSSNTTDISWTDVPLNASHIVVERSDGTNNSFVALDTITADNRSYSDVTVSDQQFYYYRLIGFNSNSASNYSENIFVAPLNHTLPATQIDTVAFTANWSGADNFDGYELEISTDNFITILKSYQTSETSMRVSELEPYQSYQYRVRYFAPGQELMSVNAQQVRTLPLAPVTSVITDITSVELSWINRFVDASDFVIARGMEFDGAYTLLDTVAADVTNYVDTDVLPSTTYFYKVLAKNGEITSFFSKPISATTHQKLEQSLQWALQDSISMTDATLMLAATASSGMPVTFSLDNENLASLDDNELRLLNAGVLSITATQAGNQEYLPVSITRSLTITKVNQIITLSLPDSILATSAPILLPEKTSMGLQVTYTVSDSQIAHVVSGKLELLKPGTVTITASNVGNNIFHPVEVSRKLVVYLKDQAIFWNLPPSVNFDEQSLQLSATASSGLPVTFFVHDETLARVDNNVLTFLKAGTAIITATQQGNHDYRSVSKTDTLLIAKAKQTITLNLPDRLAVKSPEIELASMTSAGLPITYALSNYESASITSGKLKALKADLITVTAYNPGDDNYLPVETSKKIVIYRRDQTIHWDLPESVSIEQLTLQLSATASSGLPVTFSTTDENLATVSGDRLNLLNAGTVTLAATQSGNDEYISAISVHTLVITKGDQDIQWNLPSQMEFTSAPIELPATTSAGLPIAYSLSDSEIATITSGKLQLLNTGSITITASNSGNGNYNPVFLTHTITVEKASQYITFTLPDEVELNESFVILNAIASSGLEVTYSSDHPKKATIVDGKLILHQPGVVEIRVTQDGDSRYFAAEPVVLRIHIRNNAFVPILYPMPSDGIFTVPEIVHPCIEQYEVLDTSGTIIASGTIDQLTSAGKIDLTAQRAGMYILNFKGCKSPVSVRLLKK